MTKEIHFICIDRRIKENGQTFVILENGQKIILPDTVAKVPALLLLNKNYEILYGDAINNYLRPKQEVEVKQATLNNLEPMAFSFSSGAGGNFGIISDNYSFLDMNHEDLGTKGNGGTRQMHNYVDLNYQDTIHAPEDTTAGTKEGKMPQGLTVEQLQQQREQEFQALSQKRS